VYFYERLTDGSIWRSVLLISLSLLLETSSGNERIHWFISIDEMRHRGIRNRAPGLFLFFFFLFLFPSFFFFLQESHSFRRTTASARRAWRAIVSCFSIKRECAVRLEVRAKARSRKRGKILFNSSLQDRKGSGEWIGGINEHKSLCGLYWRMKKKQHVAASELLVKREAHWNRLDRSRYLIHILIHTNAFYELFSNF